MRWSLVVGILIFSLTTLSEAHLMHPDKKEPNFLLIRSSSSSLFCTEFIIWITTNLKTNLV